MVRTRTPVAFALLFIAGPVVGYTIARSEVDVLCIVAFLGLCSLVLVPFLRTKIKDPFEPIYWASGSFFLHFCARFVIDYFEGSRYLGAFPFDDDTLQAWRLSLLYLMPSFALFLWGYYSKWGVVLAEASPSLSANWDLKKAKIAVYSLALLGLSAFLLEVKHFGAEVYFTDKNLTRVAWGIGPFEILKVTVTFALFLSYMLLRTMPGHMGVTTIGLFFLNLFVVASSGSRGAFLSWVLSMMVIAYYLKSSIPRKYVMLFGALFLLLPVYDLFAHSGGRDDLAERFSNVGIESISITSAIHTITSRAYGLDALVIVIRDTPKIMEYQLGKTIAPVLIAWIPRAVWPDKPITSAGKIYAQTYFAAWYYGSETAVAVTIFGDAYVNFHIFGMLSIGLISGIVLRWFYLYFVKQGGLSGVFVYGAMFSMVFFFWENAIYGAIMSYVPPLVLLLLTIRLISVPKSYVAKGRGSW